MAIPASSLPTVNWTFVGPLVGDFDMAETRQGLSRRGRGIYFWRCSVPTEMHEIWDLNIIMLCIF